MSSSKTNQLKKVFHACAHGADNSEWSKKMKNQPIKSILTQNTRIKEKAWKIPFVITFPYTYRFGKIPNDWQH